MCLPKEQLPVFFNLKFSTAEQWRAENHDLSWFSRSTLRNWPEGTTNLETEKKAEENRTGLRAIKEKNKKFNKGFSKKFGNLKFLEKTKFHCM